MRGGRGEEKWHSVPRVAIKQGTVGVISFSKTYKNLPQADSGLGDETCVYFQFQPAATYSKKQQRIPEASVSLYSFRMSVLSFISAYEFKNNKINLLTLKIL